MKKQDQKILVRIMTILGTALLIAGITMLIVAKEFPLFNYGLLSCGALLLLGSFIFVRKRVFSFLRSSLFMNLSRELITLVLVLILLGLANYLSFKNNKELDLTKYQLHSLSAQTKNVLKGLQKDLEFVLFAKRSDWNRYLVLLNMYKRLKPEVTLRVIDTDSEPGLVALNKVTVSGTMLIKYQGREYRTVLKDELALTNALMKISQKKSSTLYFSTGHSESSLSDESQGGLSYLSSVLKNASYKMGIIPLEREMPKEANVFFITDPKVDFTVSEILFLERFLERGGNLILTLSPRFDGSELKNIQTFLTSKGINFINGIVLDRLSASSGGQASTAMIDSYLEDNPITKGFKGRTLFPVSSFFKTQTNSKYSWSSVINSTTFPATWGETNFSEVESGRATYTADKDYKGPLAIAALGLRKDQKGRILVFGSSSFIANQLQGQANNFNLFLNAIGWMGDEKSIKSLNRPNLKGNLIYISDIHFGLIFYVVILFFPFLFFGLSVYFYKRKLSQ